MEYGRSAFQYSAFLVTRIRSFGRNSTNLQAVIDHAYRSIDVTTQTAKYLIKAYCGDGPRRSYWVGCSTGGRQGMVMSQNFPDYFDGVVAGDPVYDLEAIAYRGLAC